MPGSLDETAAAGDADIVDYLVTARSLDEYRQMFALSDTDLVDALGARAVSVDPAYAMSPSEIGARARDDAAPGNGYLRAHHDNYDWSTFGSPDDHYAHRLGALETFTVDLRLHPDRYVAAALPSLPFTDRQFDLVLCANLLFTYDDRLAPTTISAYLRELVRVARDEVRVFPLLGYAGAISPALELVLSDLQADGAPGIDVRRQSVPYRFQRGAEEALICRRR